MEIYDRDGCVVEMCDLPRKDRDPICKDRANISQTENPSSEKQLQGVKVKECHADSGKPPRNIFVHRNETLPADVMNHTTEAKKKITDQKDLMADSAIGVFTPPPSPPPFHSPLLHPDHTRSNINGSQFAVQRSEFQDESRLRPNGGNSRNSFYVRLSLVYIACSTVLAIFIPVLGIPAVVYSIRSYRAYKRGGLQQSRHLNLLAFRLILVAGASLCCLAMVSGFLTAYLLVRPTQIVSTEPPTMQVKSAPLQSNRNLFRVQGREFFDGRHNVSVLCQSRTRCDTSYSSISSDQAALPLDDPSWNPPEPLATLFKRAEVKILKSPVVPKASRGPS